MLRLVSLAAVVVCAVALLTAAEAAPWIAPAWGGREPSFPPGSLYFRTGEYPACPVMFRTVIQVREVPVRHAGLLARVPEYAYVFLNGQEVGAQTQSTADEGSHSIAAELTGLLRPGPNVLVVSAGAAGFSLEGGVRYADGEMQRFGTGQGDWKVQKLPPLTVLEGLEAMRPEAEVSDWFPVAESEGAAAQLSDQELDSLCERLAAARLAHWDEDAEWRLHLLATKGIAVVDWEAHGWGGAGRLASWVRELAGEPATPGAPVGTQHARAEALCRYVVLRDEATNLRNLAAGFGTLAPGSPDAAACRAAAASMEEALPRMEGALRARQWPSALEWAGRAEEASASARSGRRLNELNWCRDNKFAWFDAAEPLDNDIAGWGLQLAGAAGVFTSPLSPAALVTLADRELVLEGWEKLEPYRVYDKPPVLGPVGMWAVLDGKPKNLSPGPDGIVYERRAQGPLTENWVLLVEALNRGGRLPVEMVFLHAPSRIAFEAGAKGTARVRVTFDAPGAQLLLLRPLKEWRGFLEEARRLTDPAMEEGKIRPYLDACRLWSRALLQYPVSFSEAATADPEGTGARRVADVYNYRELKDAWGTSPLLLAPLPPLATYGLLKGYPGLRVISKTEVLGSRGAWGDEVAAVGEDHIVYQVPSDPIKRFGGFTSYRFWPHRIDAPGTVTELEAAARAGANSYRMQHNESDESARQVVQWCQERGLQFVFNADEKWIPDIVEHYRQLAREYRDYPPDAVAYDLLNEPETRDPESYNALVRKVVRAIREIDQQHLIYVEAIPEWGLGSKPYPKAALEHLASTGDPRTCYSFHDYTYRLPARWPNDESDVRTLLSRWIPALKLSIDYGAPIHLGEFGAFEQTDQDCHTNACAITMMTDYLRVFDQFGWHWHYYLDPFLTDRNLLRPRRDGSLQESYVHEAVRRSLRR